MSPPWPSAPRGAAGDDHSHLTTNQVGRQGDQSIVLILRPPEFDRDVAALDIAGLGEALAEGGHDGPAKSSAMAAMYPITGIAACCPRAANGHVAAPPRIR